MAWITRRWRSDHQITLFKLVRSLSSSTSSGCFAGIPGLHQPQNWNDLAQDATAKCQDLVNQVITSPPSPETVRLLDDISDTLCKVLDAAEFCRNVHSNHEWRAAAERVCIDLGSYVHELNTHYSLYSALKAAIPSTSTSSSSPLSSFSPKSPGKLKNTDGNDFSEETLLVGRMLLRDFERYGVHLDGTARDQMTHLVSTTQALGFAFTQNIIDPGRCGQLKLTEPEALDAVQRLPYELRRLFRPWQRHKEESIGAMGGSIQGLVMSGTSSSLLSLITHSDDEVLRKEAYGVYCTSPKENLKILDHLVNARHEMAALMGFDSYAAYQLDNFSLAATPHAVETFLDELAQAIKPAAEKEALVLADIKRKGKRKNASSSLLLEPWDRDWAISNASHGGFSDQLARHFEQHVTLDGCLAALSLLLERILKIKIIEESVSSSKNELWAPGVRKLRVVDCNSGAFIGIVYLDLYKRDNKFPGAAHFTLRCGKKNRNFVLGRSHGREKQGYLQRDSEEKENKEHGLIEEYQTPVVALVANFRKRGGGDGGGAGHENSKVNLNHREVETFFHEFGHALNSLLSRTEYQHLSGTRGPQDVIEIPSHVFERFTLDYETIKMLVQLSSTGFIGTNGSSINNGTAISKSDSKEIEKTAEMLASAALGSKREFAALTLQSTLSLCAIDQVLHGKNPPVGTDAEKEIAEIMQKHNSIYTLGGENHHRQHGALLHRLHPHIRFNHLIGYGSNYYCYLFAQCISSSLWESQGGATTPEKKSEETGAGPVVVHQDWPDGTVLRRQLLEPGGAKPAYRYISDLFTNSTANNNKDQNTTNTSNEMLVAVENHSRGDGSTGEKSNTSGTGSIGWYPKFDSLLRHLGIYRRD